MEILTQIIMWTIASYVAIEAITVAYIVYNRRRIVPLLQARIQWFLGTSSLKYEVSCVRAELEALRTQLETPNEAESSEDELSDEDDNQVLYF
jgi:hypothetical protein